MTRAPDLQALLNTLASHRTRPHPHKEKGPPGPPKAPALVT